MNYLVHSHGSSSTANKTPSSIGIKCRVAMSVIYVRRASVALFFQGVGGGWFVGSKARVLIQIRFSDVRAETKQLAAHWIDL